MVFVLRLEIPLSNWQHQSPHVQIIETFMVAYTAMARVAFTRRGNTSPPAPVGGEVQIIGTELVDLGAGGDVEPGLLHKSVWGHDFPPLVKTRRMMRRQQRQT